MTRKVSVFKSSTLFEMKMSAYYFKHSTSGSFPYFGCGLIFPFVLLMIFGLYSTHFMFTIILSKVFLGSFVNAFVFLVWINIVIIAILERITTVDIKIQKANVVVIHRLNNSVLKYKEHQLSQITKLEKIEECRYPNANFQSLQQQMRFNPVISIHVDDQQYQIRYITQSEADRLGAELSNWLGLPLEHRYIPVRDK